MLIYDTLYEHREINYIGVRHEQAATYMADGYARSTGRVGVCLTTTAAMAEAYSSSSPVLQICTQTQSSLLNRGKGALHEAKDQLGLFRAVTGWNKRFMMGCQELATAVQHQINPPVLIFNNQGYGVLRETQDIEFSGRRIGVDLFSPDFIKFAEAFGTEGVRVARLEELAPAINKALQAQKPTLIEVVGPLIEPLS